MKTRNDKGQMIIILAFAVIAVMALVGLAIDGGRLYTSRRQTQNAADAGVMAGARELGMIISECEEGTVENNNRVAMALIELARLNGVDYYAPDANIKAWYVDANEVELAELGGTIPTGATGVKARMVITDSTTFLKIVGQQHVVASAEAMAMVGPIRFMGGGVLPIGVPEIALTGLNPGDEWSIYDGDGVFCRDHDDYCFLNPGDDPDNPSPGSQHGWLNLSHIYNVAYWEGGPMDRAFVKNVGSSGCKYNSDGSIDVGGTGLKGWASYECPYPYPIIAGAKDYTNGDFIHGIPGMNTSALKETEDLVGQIVYLPVFDYVYGVDTLANDIFPGKEPAVGWAQATGMYYHVIGFVAAELVEVGASGNPKYLTGSFESVIIGDGEITPGAGLGSGGSGSCSASEATILGVKLWR